MWGDSRVYLDWAAAAPVSERVRGVFATALSVFGNPGAVHTEGARAKALLEDARTRIARLLGVKSEDVIFTSGATESNNLAIQSIGTAARMNGISAPHLLYLPSSHASIVETMQAMERFGFVVEALPTAHGTIDIDALKKIIRPETVLISMDLVCGETGTLWNTRDVRRLLDTLGNTRPLLHVDAVQAPYAELCERTHIGADIIVLDAQKVGGIRGVGLLTVSRSLPTLPLLHGGGQERGLRSGTPSPALATAFATALTEAAEQREKFTERSGRMRAHLIERLRSIPNLEINAGSAYVSHILNVSLIGRDTDYLIALLDTDGFAVSTRSACESESENGSRSVRLLTGDATRATSTLRISWGPTTKESELMRFAEALHARVRFLDEKAI